MGFVLFPPFCQQLRWRNNSPSAIAAPTIAVVGTDVVCSITSILLTYGNVLTPRTPTLTLCYTFYSLSTSIHLLLVEYLDR